tara:strand:- start:4883 stop:9964 length:5082 start_codon:yes stop_codon:yes gene_type:complete
MYFVSNTYAGDIVVTTTGGVDEIIGNAIALTGAATGAPEASAAANSVTNTITTNITTITSNAWLVDVVGSSLNGSFTPNVSQTEASDQQTGTGGGRGGGTGASSTKLIATPTVNTPMIQTHSDAGATNDLVHAIAAVAPTTTIALESTSNGFTSINNNTTFTWTHNFNDSNVDNKLVVGVVVEDRTNGCTTGTTLSGQSVEVSSITHDGNNLTRIAYQTIRIAIGGQDRCLRAELWYIDIDAPPAPLAEWRMDEGSWSGTAGEVTDITGNGYDGTARNGSVTDNTTPAIATDPGTCGYGVFDDAGGTNGDYIELASFPDQTTDFTITAWIRTSDNTRAGQRIFADDENNTGGYALSVGDPGAGRLRFYSRGAALEIIDTPTGGTIANNTWYFVAGVADITGSQIRTYIYDTSGTLVDSASGAITGAWTTDTGVASIAGETNSGETGNRFFGNVDEVHFYTDVLSVSELAAVIKETHPCPAVGDITVNFSANINSIMAGSVSLTNASLGDPESSGNSINTTGATIGPTALTSSLNAWLVDGVVSETAGSFSFAGQTERWEETIGGAVAAMSTKADVAAGANSMSQTHTVGGTNRKGHVAVSVAPFDTSTNIAFDSVASTTGTGNSIAWSHSLTTTNTSNTKLLVTIAFEEGGTCNDNINSVTYGSLALTQVVQAQISGGGSCKQVEIWYVDLTNIIVSTNNNSTLGGQAMDQDEAVEYDAAFNSGTLFLDDAIFSGNTRVDAIHALKNGNIALAISGNAGITVDGNFFEEDDIVEIKSDGTFVQKLFSEDNFTSAEDNGRDIDAVYIRNNGNIVLSVVRNESLPGIGNFDDDDIVEWDGATASLVFNIASIAGAANNWDVDGVHFLNDDPNLILFSLLNNRTIGPNNYLDGDVLLYNRNTSTLSVYFSESNFSSGNEDIDALTLSVTVVADQVDHYAISYPLGTPGVTCEALSVRITAHGDPTDHANIVAPSNTTTITLSTSPAADGWTLKSGSGTFTPPNQYTFDGTEVFAEFWLTETTATTVPHIDIDVDDGTATDLDGVLEDDNIEFANAVFRFFDGGGTGESIETQIAGKESDINPLAETLQLRSVITNTSTMACESRILNTTTIEMAYKCNNPSTCQGAPRVQIENAAAATFDITPGNNNAATVDATTGNYNNVDLDFGATGTATFSFDFNDVGQVELFARETLAAVAPDPAITVFGTSNRFIVRPFGFDVQVTANPAATGPGGTKFTEAGEDFITTVRAVAWDATGDDGVPIGTANDGIPDGHESGDTDPSNNTDLSSAVTFPTTPNYGQEGINEATDEDIDLSALLNQPAGIDPGLSGGTSITAIAAGSGNSSTVNYDEVGIIEITAQVAVDDDYLGGGAVIGKSGYVGRFVPYVFEATTPTPAEFGPACGTFSYIGQGFTYTTAPVINLTAKAKGIAPAFGSTTQNYTGTFFKLTDAKLVADGDKTYAAASGTLDTGLVPSPDPVIADSGGGAATLTFSDGGGIAFNRGNPEDSFDADIALSINVLDTDDVFAGNGSGVNQNPVSFGTATAGNGIAFTGGNKEQRWGRLVLDNAFGSELLPVEIPIRAEYQSSGDFITNTDDGCTAYTSANISFNNHSGITAGANLSASGAGTLISGVDDDANPVILSNTLLETGSVDVTYTLGLPLSWLLYDWDNDTNHDNDSSSRATWGIFAGPDEFIYIREPW